MMNNDERFLIELKSLFFGLTSDLRAKRARPHNQSQIKERRSRADASLNQSRSPGDTQATLASYRTVPVATPRTGSV
jgi:hypothetical protein